MELLAPAGTLETFGAALDGGADAIYVGAPGFNARNLARDLRIEEIGAMIRHCHGLNKKLFVAANSLILERELPLVIENLALLQELGPDALIVQDLGLIRLVRQYFPKLKLHGSTLMTAHNSDGVHFLSDLGCKRVVLARELTLKEIGVIAARRGRRNLRFLSTAPCVFPTRGSVCFLPILAEKAACVGAVSSPAVVRIVRWQGGRKGAKIRQKG